MAGLFGFFNYDKEGPGVPKNAPKKKTFVVFFELFFRNFWKFIPINLVYWLISIPFLTNGIANVGMTNVARNTARNKHSFGLSDFFETVKKNLKQSVIAGVVNTLIYALLIFDFWFFYNQKGGFGVVGMGVTMALLVTFSMMCFYLWTLIITFNYNLKTAYKNSFKLVFLNFKYSFLCLFINVMIVVLNVALLFLLKNISLYVLIIEILCLLCVYPAFKALLVQFCTFPTIKKFIIDPYYKEHPDEDIEKRRNLGLEIEETSKKETTVTEEDDDCDEDEEVIFED